MLNKQDWPGPCEALLQCKSHIIPPDPTHLSWPHCATHEALSSKEIATHAPAANIPQKDHCLNELSVAPVDPTTTRPLVTASTWQIATTWPLVTTGTWQIGKKLQSCGGIAGSFVQFVMEATSPE